MRAVLLLNDNDQVSWWEHEALRAALAGGMEVVLVARCMNTPPRRLDKTTLPYYALAWLAHRGLDTVSLVDVNDLVPSTVRTIRFNAQKEGAWQRIPTEVAEQFKGADVVVKFGMTLLRGADDLPVEHGVLSFHHGAPEEYRGRPAGYYELHDNQASQGVIVQRLSDALDGGVIVARARSKVVPHSYRQTLRNAHRAGVPLLRHALQHLSEAQGEIAPPATLGPNYRLPTPGHVLTTAGLIVGRGLSRVLYGAVREKEWKVGFSQEQLLSKAENSFDASKLNALPTPSGYVFAADPFMLESGTVVAELMEAASGLGVIGSWDGTSWKTDLIKPQGHVSYPFPVRDRGRTFIFPEVASHSAPQLWEVDAEGAPTGAVLPLEGLEDERVVDGTLFRHGDHWYLFGGGDDAAQRLELWVSPELTGPWRIHPRSPVNLDVRGARMAGPISEIGGALFRFGQDCSRRYGDGVTIHRIEALSPESYAEVVSGTVRLDGAHGPHTLVPTPKGILLDYYLESTTPLAGYRRLAALVKRKVGGRASR